MLLKLKKLERKVLFSLLFCFVCIPSIISKDFFGLTLNIERVVIPFLGVFFSFLVIMNLKVYKSFILNKYNLFLLVWFAYAVITVLWVIDIKEWFKGVYFLGIGIFLLLLVEYTAVKYKLLNRYINILVFCMVFHNVIGWIEIIGKKYFFLPNIETKIQYSYYHYPVSVFGNTNDFATFLSLGIFFLFIKLYDTRKRTIKLFYFVLSCSSLILILFTTSRANIMGLIIALFFAMLLKLPLWNRKNVKWFWGFLVFLIPLIGLVLFLAYDIIYSLLINQNSSDNIRMALIVNGLISIKDTIGLGVGSGNIENYMQNFGQFNTGHIVNMHNLWFEILSSYGVFIFITYLVGYIKLIYYFLEQFVSKNKVNKKNARIFICLLICFIFSCMSSSSLLSATWMWGIFGLVLAVKDDMFLLMERKETRF